MHDSGVLCDEVIESYNKKTKNFYILVAFLLITIALLIVISISCYLIKYQAIQKHLLPFHVTINELKKIMY